MILNGRTECNERPGGRRTGVEPMTLFACNFNRRARAAVAGIAVAAALAAGLGGAGAQAQTVADYEAALAAAMNAPNLDAACQPLVNYTFVSMSEADKVDPSPIFGLLRLAGGWADEADPAASARAACMAKMKHPVITFDGGLGEDIVAQPPLEDPNKPVGEQRPYY